jgi:hypothetical protein
MADNCLLFAMMNDIRGLSHFLITIASIPIKPYVKNDRTEFEDTIEKYYQKAPFRLTKNSSMV